MARLGKLLVLVGEPLARPLELLQVLLEGADVDLVLPVEHLVLPQDAGEDADVILLLFLLLLQLSEEAIPAVERLRGRRRLGAPALAAPGLASLNRKGR